LLPPFLIVVTGLGLDPKTGVPTMDAARQHCDAEDAARQHYDADYFASQAKDGILTGQAELFKFEPCIKPTDRVLDFGCGGGFLLKVVTAAEKIGVEINPHAVAAARANGVTIFPDVSEVPDEYVDIVISNHALEHVTDPFRTVSELRRVLRKGGLLVLVTPYDASSTKFALNDRNMHLFGWSPLNLGNLVTVCGFTVVSSEVLNHRWFPGWPLVVKYLGWQMFHLGCRICGTLRRNFTQIRLVATKP
jgi:SAM-dependent methyltransferase